MSYYTPPNSGGGGGGVSAVTATSPLASSGGDSPNISLPAGFGMQVSVASLTDAEVKALGATPFTVVPAPGSGKIILPMAAALYIPGVSTYAATLNFSIAGNDLYDWASALSPGTSQISPSANGNFFTCQGGIFGDNSAWTDQPMTVACTGGITGAGNGIVLTIWYLTWETA